MSLHRLIHLNSVSVIQIMVGRIPGKCLDIICLMQAKIMLESTIVVINYANACAPDHSLLPLNLFK